MWWHPRPPGELIQQWFVLTEKLRGPLESAKPLHPCSPGPAGPDSGFAMGRDWTAHRRFFVVPTTGHPPRTPAGDRLGPRAPSVFAEPRGDRRIRPRERVYPGVTELTSSSSSPNTGESPQTRQSRMPAKQSTASRSRRSNSRVGSRASPRWTASRSPSNEAVSPD